MYDFVVIGDILIDRILIISDPDIVASADENAGTVIFPYPRKVQLEQPFQVHYGGNAYNAASALQSLGKSVALYSVVGNDDEGKKMVDGIKERGINCDCVTYDSENPTNESVILSIGKDRVILNHHYKRKYKLENFPETKFVYFTSLGEDDYPFMQELVKLKQERNFKLIFSPGTLQLEEPFLEVKEMLANTDLLIMNKEEAKKLSRLNTHQDENLLQGLRNLGPKTVVMTKSSHGSIAYDGQNVMKVGALKVDVLDTTGAGDVYSATVAAGLSSEEELKTAMEWGALNAASSVTEYGATTGILDLQKLKEWHEKRASELMYTEPVSETPTHAEINTISNPLE